MTSSMFGRYWTAATISSFGTALTAVALPVLVVQVLDASPFQVGLVNAAQFVPYAVFGLLIGVYVDRWPRKPLLVIASVGRAVALAVIPLLWLLDALALWMLISLLLAFGTFSVLGFAATQSLLPRIVPRSRIVTANARLDQTDAAAQTLGPALGGIIVALVSAPVVFLIDAVSYVVDAVLIGSLTVEERRDIPSTPRSVRREIGEGLHFAYRHPVLGPLAVSAHLWFIANAAAFTVLAIVTLREFELSPLHYGLLLASGGIAGLLGATLAPRIGRRLGAGTTIFRARVCYPIAWTAVLLALLVQGPSPTLAIGLLFVAVPLHGFIGGFENANEMGLRQQLTPDPLLGRTNATIRSANRFSGAIGAILGGLAVTLIGSTLAVAGIIVILVVSAIFAANPAIRAARLEM